MIASGGIHALDLLRYLLGQEATEVSAFSNGQSEGGHLEDLGMVLLRFTGGAYGCVTCSRRVPDTHNDVVVYGSKIQVQGSGTLDTDLKGELVVTNYDTVRTTGYRRGSMYTFLVEDFTRSVVDNAEPAATGMDGLRATELLLAIYESVRTGRSVQIDHRPI